MADGQWPEFVRAKWALKSAARVAGPADAAHDMVDEKIPPGEAVDWIYAVLNTLDTKASALMRLNGVLIAAAAFMLGLFRRDTILATSGFDAVAVVVAALLSAISMTLCLLVVNVGWHFLGLSRRRGTKYAFGDEITALSNAMTFRQKAYMAAWKVSVIASAIFLLEFGRQALHIILDFAATSPAS